ncbi:carboxypeptidase-like regulatory domain-containing protein [Cytophagaceae bacterium ABcell3]|nr:carboxypeptidase-like regulatory domain-containing protein [Cytophagaceae bacterium ABcell3]
MKKFLLTSFLFLFSLSLYSQDDESLVQVSGIVVGGDSLYGLPGAYVVVPQTGRGTTTNHVGYFSLPAVAGDSIVVRSIGFQENFFLVPDDGRTSISVVVELVADTAMLPEVEVFPFPTEQLFRQAFLALELPEEELDNMQRNLNDQVMRRMLANTPAGSGMNHRYFLQQQVVKTETRFFSPTFSFLNPFAWRQFINDVRRGGLQSPDLDD